MTLFNTYISKQMLLFWGICCLLLLSEHTAAQTINQRFHFNQRNAILCGIIPTDSCIYTSGIYLAHDPTSNLGSFIAKHTLDGSVEWFKTLSDSPNSIELWYDAFIPTYDGGFANVGYAEEYATGVLSAFFVKYNPFGDTLFTRSIASWDTATINYIRPTQLVQTADSGYAFAADFQATGQPADITLIKLNKDGDFQWRKEFGEGWQDVVRSLTIAQDGGFFLGAYKNNGTIIPMNYTWLSRIIKTDSAGDFEWEYFSDETLVEGVHDLIETPDGGYIYGSGWGTEFNGGNSGTVAFEGYVVKLDDQLQVEWDLILDGDPRMFGGEVHVSALLDGNYAVADVIKTLDTTETIPNLGFTDYGRLTKLSPQGQIIWQRWYFPTDIHDDHFHDIYDLKTTNDGFAMVGMSIRWFADSLGQQGWLIKTDTAGCLTPGCGSVGTDEFGVESTAQMLVYPNPATSQVSIDLTLPAGTVGGTVQIIDMLGRAVYSESIPFCNTSYLVNTSNWESGAYVVVVVTEEVKIAQQVVILDQ